MIVRDLIAILLEADPMAEVRLATQPQYPMQSTVACATVDQGVVWLAEGMEMGYLQGSADVVWGLAEDEPGDAAVAALRLLRDLPRP